MKKLALLALLLFPVLAPAQTIPAGYIQATATVPILANGSFGAAWTNLSSSPQLGLLGCVSTFQTTVNGTIDSFGKFSVLLADPGQICPSPSTWTFTFSCYKPPGAFITPITVTGAGSIDDISAQIIAAAPTNICQGGGGGGGLASFTSGPFDPFFTTSLGSDPTHNPALTFTAESNPTFTFPGNFTSGSASWAAWTLVQGSNITLTPNTGAKTLTLSATASSSGCTTSGATDQAQGANGSGGCVPITTQVNGTNLAAPLLPNVVAGSNVSVTNPSANEILISATGAPPSFEMAVIPPAAGQFVVIRPTICAFHDNNARTSSACGQTALTANSGAIGLTAQSGSFPPAQGTMTYTGWSLPGYVNPANVTAVYMIPVAGVFGNGSDSILCGVDGGFIGPSLATQKTFTTSITGTGVASLSCVSETSNSLASPQGGNFSVPDMRLAVFYSGPAPPTDTAIQIYSPILWFPDIPALELDPAFPANLFGTYTIATLPSATVNAFNMFLATDSTTTSGACNSGSGTHIVICYSDGTNWQIYVGGGGGSGTVTSITAGTGLTGGTITTSGTIALATALPNGETATTQTIGDNTTKVATDAFVLANAASAGVSSIDTLTGAFTFGGPGVSHTGNAYTFSGTGSGVSSLNSLSGALSLTSTGSTVTITPSGSTIDLEAVGGGGSGVQYNPSTTQYIWIGDSRLIVNGTPQLTASAVSCTGGGGGTCTVTATNTLTSSDYVTFNSGMSPACISAVAFKVVSATGSSFVISNTSEGGLSVCGTTTGTGGIFWNGDTSLPYATAKTVFYNGHGTTINMGLGGDTVAAEVANYTARYHTQIAACVAGGGPCFVHIQTGYNDPPATEATIEGNFLALWALIHADGATVVQSTAALGGVSGGISNQRSSQILSDVNVWMSGQGDKTTAPATGQYWDRIVPFAGAVGSPYGPNFLSNFTDLSSRGTALGAQTFNDAMSAQGSLGIGNTPTLDGYNVWTGVNYDVWNPTDAILHSYQDLSGYYAEGFGNFLITSNYTALHTWKNVGGAWTYSMPDNACFGLQSHASNQGQLVTNFPDTMLCRNTAGQWSLDTTSPNNHAGNVLLTAVTVNGAAGGTFVKADGTGAGTPAGFANPMTTLGDTIYGGASGVPARLAGPTTTGHTFVISDVPSGGAAIAPAWLDLATYLASPPPIGGTTPNAGTFTALQTGTGSAGCAGITGCLSLAEAGTAGTPTAGADYVRADSTTHSLLASLNGAAEAPIAVRLPVGNVTFTAGSGVTSVVCATSYTCTNARGEFTLVGGTATTGTIATVNFSTTLGAAPFCTVSTNGNGGSSTTSFDLGHGVPSTSSFTVTAGITVIGATINIDYVCGQ